MEQFQELFGQTKPNKLNLKAIKNHFRTRVAKILEIRFEVDKKFYMFIKINCYHTREVFFICSTP